MNIFGSLKKPFVANHNNVLFALKFPTELPLMGADKEWIAFQRIHILIKWVARTFK
jgi:hypothetical protein